MDSCTSRLVKGPIMSSSVSSSQRPQFVCASCAKSYRRKVQLRQHMELRHSDTPKKHVCSDCPAQYGRADHLKRHRESAHADRSKLVCPQCSSEFATPQTLEKHQRRHEDRIFKCNWAGCSRAFLKHQHLRVHQFEHTAVKPFVCDQCDRRFLLPSQLRHHQKVHLGYTCKVDGCGETFQQWTKLRRHVSESHPVEHRCSVCSKVFKDPRRLRKHEDRHQCEVNCPVSDCPVKLQPKYLNGHMKKCHQSIEQRKRDELRRRSFHFKCSACAKLFANVHHLKRHESEVHNKLKYAGVTPPDKRSSIRSPSCSQSGGEEEPKMLGTPVVA